MSTSIRYKKRQTPLLIYILGWGRSGSSILANVLGSMSGAAGFGELRYIWDRGIIDNTICGCGQDFHDCEFWKGIPFANTPFPDIPTDQAQRLANSIGSRARMSQMPAVFNGSMRARYLTKNAADVQAVLDMYNALFKASETNIVVDASKSPFFAVNLLDQRRNFDVLFLHLTRDPRAVLHSWRKRKKREEGGQATFFPRYSSPRSLLQWRFVNSSCERFSKLLPGSYARIRYEDFVTDWKQSLIQGAPDVFELDDRAAQGGPVVHSQHSISGNPSRFNLGEINLRLDTDWETKLRGVDSFLASRLVAGPARRYGYSI